MQMISESIKYRNIHKTNRDIVLDNVFTFCRPMQLEHAKNDWDMLF